ncbi:FUSC family protein [Cellulomonas sp. ATA003]|uniref:FUSC family protein n=1 Tax=Cellulomonas sp. ATA003 TaxID=3073064 RepID=UPI0028739E74|nr:FUSC family protein [Cellulomonas sp. ATA003]WNB85892.1 FUSC family protein [Cellulomonas sp. ATA003]
MSTAYAVPVPRRRSVRLRARVRQGVSRVRGSAVAILQAGVAAGGSYAIARYGLDHPYPFFAPVSAWIALGFSQTRQLRKVAELAIGVAIGVALGDLLAHLIGAGWWQIGLALVLAASVGRFLDRGGMLATQSGVQAIVVVGLPASVASGGAFGRWTDALVGGAVAVAVAALTPGDPRRLPRRAARAALLELVATLGQLVRGLRAGSVDEVEDALLRGRASQPAFDEWRAVALGARDMARVSPRWLRHRDELTALQTASALGDRALRNARVIARRCGPLCQGPHRVEGLALVLEELGSATEALAEAFGAGAGLDAPRRTLEAIAVRMDPFVLAPDDWQVQSVVLLLRSLVVDLLEVAGADPAVARALLPEI